MDNLVQKYRELDCKCAMFDDMLASERKFENEIFMPCVSKKEEYFNSLAEIIKCVEEISAPDEVFAIIKEQMKNFMSAQKMELTNAYKRPYAHINNLSYSISGLLGKDCREVEAREKIVLNKLSKVSDLCGAINEWLCDVAPVYLQELIGACDVYVRTAKDDAAHLGEYLPQYDSAAVYAAMYKSCEDIKELSNNASTIVSQKGIVPKGETPDDGVVKFETEYYRELLQNQLGIELDELLSWYESEVEKTRAEVFEIASKLDIPEPTPKTMEQINNVLVKYAGPYENGEEMMKKAQEYLNLAKRECAVWIPLPEETCLLCSMPERIKYSYPWGGYGGGCKRRRPLIGEYYVNDFNYTAVTDGWIKMMALHEAYAGHHVQFVRTTLDPLPEVVKIGARSVPITEGTAHRSERLFEYIYGDDQFYPLFAAYRAHHTSVRVKAELWLRYFGKTIGEVTDLYCRELGFDRATARGQVSAQESMQGYFNSYYYGLKKIKDLEKKYGFSPKEYTEFLFDAGRISIDLLDRFLALSPADKHRYTHDFASLLQFE